MRCPAKVWRECFAANYKLVLFTPTKNGRAMLRAALVLPLATDNKRSEHPCAPWFFHFAAQNKRSEHPF